MVVEFVVVKRPDVVGHVRPSVKKMFYCVKASFGMFPTIPYSQGIVLVRAQPYQVELKLNLTLIV